MTHTSTGGGGAQQGWQHGFGQQGENSPASAEALERPAATKAKVIHASLRKFISTLLWENRTNVAC
jgi:hypothetical protein